MRVRSILLGASLAVLATHSAGACCALQPDFAVIARTAPTVVRARVVALSHGRLEATATAPAEYVDLQVLAVRKGPRVASTIRVWDADRHSCMSGGLDGLRVGERVVLAAQPVADVKAESLAAQARGSLRRTAVELPDGDYMIRGCGRYWKARSASARWR